MRVPNSVYASAKRIARIPPSHRSYATPATYNAQQRDPQLADYPDVPFVSNQTLPARGWWDQQMRRNFGDPVHENDEVLSMWGPDPPVVPPRTALLHFSIAAMTFVSFGLLCNFVLLPERPTVPREYPYSGLVRELGGLEENKARDEGSDAEDE
ncbi:NADH dehydrogenase 1 beta subcomplex [Serpula lacrymans var. lacrymans S7.3]|uniref:NADH dehydrogenase 1 beta subcomplex n=2 Tax=Serpula lacrymans var. lacrymans TaxID=341189 RepID=F8PYD1_SERL3|nr:Ndufb8, NADH dehydrogenase 19kDa subunit [Serpula lacrymans var. lacrymans S7.9]EGN98894.1 NADH dehydrogenase 1 beta subcomplex [Serpula lacrymans var. lacrymans S7.3]EGO24488.1 Ndufb8, NADH dehydrogenase 19kDa subunit [Serpula lacrymans var. lacrymans S7.9]